MIQRKWLSMLMMAVVVGMGFQQARAAEPLPAGLLGIEAIEDTLLFHAPSERRVRNIRPDDDLPAMRILLSRSRYWLEDGHLDVVAQFHAQGDVPPGGLLVQIKDANNMTIWRMELASLPAANFIFYPQIPGQMKAGDTGTLDIAWIVDGQVQAEHAETFRVEQHGQVPPTGSIGIRVVNEAGITARNMPMTVGVPLPRGAVQDVTQLRLVSASGQTLPLQVKQNARWSRFGSVKWVLCDFAVDLEGQDQHVQLVYGPQATQQLGEPMTVHMANGFPTVKAGRLRIDDGLWFDQQGDGRYVKLLDEQALHGAFVERGDGQRFEMPTHDTFDIEEHGPRKVVLRREGWYQGLEDDQAYCQYVTRYVIHHDSPLVRIFHTWIFTGDGNRETIANMGWRFPWAGSARQQAFLTSFEDDGQWQPGQYLLQHDYEHFEIVDQQQARDYPKGRAPGAARLQLDGVKLYFGTRDFWQNYPSELEFADGALWFHNWPRHNKPARYRLDGELITSSGQPALPSARRHEHYQPDQLTRSEWKLNVIQARFAHEGSELNFRLPQAMTENPIWERSRRGRAASQYWDQGNPESANAQGISRTEEMWLYVAGDTTSDAQAARILRALNDQQLRPVVDPAWMADSGAFYEIHQQDKQKYPEDERLYELIARAPGKWIERLGLYGMWIYGDLAVWGPRLTRREPDLYRAFRKRHQGWPYSWIPYVRSGDSEFLRLADAATRQNIDANYCHYVSLEVEQRTGPDNPRRIGRLHRSTLPWATRMNATTRCYESATDFLWHAYFLTGYHRAKDNAMSWAQQTKQEENLFGRGPIGMANRASVSLLRSYLEMYEATMDPWFLVGAHAIAQGHLAHYREGRWSSHGAGDQISGVSHFWDSAEREFLRFTGSQAHEQYYLDYAQAWTNHRSQPSWALFGAPMIEPAAHAWRITGDEYYLRRLVSYLDWARVAVLDAQPMDYLQGSMASGTSALFAGWYLQVFPLAIRVLEQAEHRPTPIHDSFVQRAVDFEGSPVVAIRKLAGQALPLSFAAEWIPTRAKASDTYSYRLLGPDGNVFAQESWPARQRMALIIPADAPAGVYRLQTYGSGRRGLEMPVSPVDWPEVIELAPGEPMGASIRGRQSQYWFFVPEGVEQFAVQFAARAGEYYRMSIWSPDGARVWDHQAMGPLTGRAEPVEARVQVQPDQAGRLWRLTIPGGGQFQMDDRIPPIYAIDPSRWFNPQ